MPADHQMLYLSNVFRTYIDKRNERLRSPRDLLRFFTQDWKATLYARKAAKAGFHTKNHGDFVMCF